MTKIFPPAMYFQRYIGTGKGSEKSTMLSTCIENPVGEERPWKQEECGEYGWEVIVHLFTNTRIMVCNVKLPSSKLTGKKKKGVICPIVRRTIVEMLIKDVLIVYIHSIIE